MLDRADARRRGPRRSRRVGLGHGRVLDRPLARRAREPACVARARPRALANRSNFRPELQSFVISWSPWIFTGRRASSYSSVAAKLPGSLFVSEAARKLSPIHRVATMFVTPATGVDVAPSSKRTPSPL